MRSVVVTPSCDGYRPVQPTPFPSSRLHEEFDRSSPPGGYGECYESALADWLTDPTLHLVRGFSDGSPHWWCETTDGTVIDRTQWAGRPRSRFDGHLPCFECGAPVFVGFGQSPEGGSHDGTHTFCDGECYARCIGF